MAETCRHCGRKLYIKRRGLCLPCYDTPSIRAKYPSAFPRKARPSPGRDDSGDRPITDADLNAIIEEQMKCLPDWWWDDFRKLNPTMWDAMQNNESENNAQDSGPPGLFDAIHDEEDQDK